jgi:sterol desaturase/sphingolipid hydroxylase (fatty acid hydroxylase superfamily)
MNSFVHLSKTSYYADFVIYPLVLMLLCGVAMDAATPEQSLIWACVCLAGIALWTLLEYGLHRFLLHQIWPFKVMHALHHSRPSDMIGAPVWLTAALISGLILLPVWWQAGFNLASGLTSGLIIGYLWYVLVHHAVHHWHVRPGSYLHRARRRHAEHHYGQHPCNYGVTTAFWDRVFPCGQETHVVS